MLQEDFCSKEVRVIYSTSHPRLFSCSPTPSTSISTEELPRVRGPQSQPKISSHMPRSKLTTSWETTLPRCPTWLALGTGIPCMYTTGGPLSPRSTHTLVASRATRVSATSTLDLPTLTRSSGPSSVGPTAETTSPTTGTTTNSLSLPLTLMPLLLGLWLTLQPKLAQNSGIGCECCW